MNLQSEAARLRATRVSGFEMLYDGLKEKGAEALDDGTSRLAQEGKDYVTEEYGESAGNIAGAALEGVQEEYFGTETPTQASTSQAMTSQASQALTSQALRGSARFNRPMLSDTFQRSQQLKRLKEITKSIDLASDKYRDLYSKSLHKKLDSNQKTLAASGRSYWIIGLSAVGVVGITAALVISANKNKKKKK